MNNVNIIGRLTADVVLNKTPNGKSVANFALAVNDGQDRTYFVDCVAWERTADLIAQYISKGSILPVSGKLTTRTYKDKNEMTHKVTEVLVERIDFVEKKTTDKQTIQNAEFTEVEPAVENDDLPF